MFSDNLFITIVSLFFTSFLNVTVVIHKEIFSYFLRLILFFSLCEAHKQLDSPLFTKAFPCLLMTDFVFFFTSTVAPLCTGHFGTNASSLWTTLYKFACRRCSILCLSYTQARQCSNRTTSLVLSSSSIQNHPYS